MVAWPLRLGVLWGIYLAGIGQVDSPPAHRPPAATPGAVTRPPSETEVIADRLSVYDRPDEKSYKTDTLDRGDRVRVRGCVAGGWVMIEPPGTTIGWIERAALDLGEQAEEEGGHRFKAEEPGSGPPERARVVEERAVVRSGHLRARMPGPPWIEVPRGTMVQLVDRPPMAIGEGPGATLWFAVVPPAGAACFVRAEGLKDAPRQDGVSEVLAAYLVPSDNDPGAQGAGAESLPAAVAAEIGRIDAMHRAILARQPIEQWRFDTVRAGYQAILKRSGDDRAVEEALRVRLARVTRHEQAASAARDFQTALARSRRHDAQVAQVRQKLAAVEAVRTRTYHAIGYVQSSSRMVDGRKLHSLIDPDGKTIAYLDLPPGLDVESLGSRRGGVRGSVHINQDLGTRLITVRELEPVGTRR